MKLLLHAALGCAVLGAALLTAMTYAVDADADDASRLARAEPTATTRDDGKAMPTLSAPDLEAWRPTFAASYGGPPPSPTGEFRYLAVAEGFNAPIFDRTHGGPRVIGRVRRGNALLARPASGPRRSCAMGGERGRWYELQREGFVCSARDFDMERSPLDVEVDQLQPDVTRPLPFRYARVTTEGAPRLSRLPTARELVAIDALGDAREDGPGVVVERMWDDFFLALDREVEHLGRGFFRTVQGEYVLKEHVTLRPTPPLVGEALDDGLEQPLAFIHDPEGAAIYCRQDGALRACGEAKHHARVFVDRRLERGGEEYVVDTEGRVLARDDVRLVEAIEPPRRVPDDAHWVHIDLSEQTLVAYEGDRPVYATLVSTGKPGHDTPTGLYQTQRKYLSKTMRGRDAVEGIYHVEEVPWVLYYRGGYAVHGAYWHNTFGNTRSHGCTNVAPADARWLYYWSVLDVPDGWHAVTGRKGTWFYFTRDRA